MTTTFTATTTNPEKIALVERLIKKEKITLEQALLLLSETVISITTDPPYQFPNYPIYTYTSGSNASGSTPATPTTFTVNN